MWQPVETAPYGRSLITLRFNNPAIKDDRHVTFAVRSDDGWRDEDGAPIHHGYTITAWMPPPAPCKWLDQSWRQPFHEPPI